MKRITLASLTAALAISAFAAAPSGNRAPETEWKNIGEGIYSDAVICNEFSGYYNDPVKVQVEQSTTNPDLYRVIKPWPDIADVYPDLKQRPEDNYMIVDVSDPDFVLVLEGCLPFETAVEGEVCYQSVTQMMVEIYERRGLGDKNAAKEALLNGQFASCCLTMKDKTITFPVNSFAVKYPNASGSTGLKDTYMPTMGDYSGYLVLPGGVYEDEWKSLGMGKMLEGFVWTVFETDPPKEKEVEVFENKDVPGVYQVRDAFTDSYEKAMPLVLDARDPEWVRIPKMDTRIKTQDFGNLWILSVSDNGFESYEHMVGFDPINAERNITLRNKYFDIPAQSVYLQFPERDNGSVMPNDLAVPSYIKLPGYEASVEDIFISSEDGDVEYYDLQGMRIAEPVAGQIVIVRKGDKVSKTIVR